jgi:hyperosmotically inducible protein
MLVAYADDVDRLHPSNTDKNAWISSLIRSNLTADNAASMTNVFVSTDGNGVVLLSGSAPSQALLDKAEAIARKTIGVNQVINQASVKTFF